MLRIIETIEKLKDHIQNSLSDTDNGIILYEMWEEHNPGMLNAFRRGEQLDFLTSPEYSPLKPILEKLQYDVDTLGLYITEAPKKAKVIIEKKSINYPPELDKMLEELEKLTKFQGKLHQKLKEVKGDDEEDCNLQRKMIAQQMQGNQKKMDVIIFQKERYETEGIFILEEAPQTMTTALENAEKARANASANLTKYKNKMDAENKKQEPDKLLMIQYEEKLNLFQTIYDENDMKVRAMRIEIKKRRNRE